MPKITLHRQVIQWQLNVAAHAYAAAEVYLTLLYNPAQVAEIVLKLKAAPIKHLKAQDIFSASGLACFEENDAHVALDHMKIQNNIALAPLLLVRDDSKGRIFIVNGYHRLCAISLLDEDVWIKCKVSRFKGVRRGKVSACGSGRADSAHPMPDVRQPR